MARWTVPLLGIALMGISISAAPTLDTDVLAPAARAAIPDSDLLLRSRKAAIAEATRSLSAAQIELESAYIQTSGAAAFDADRWRARVDDIKERYQIWGTVDRQHPDSHSENALHSSLYLLYSMEHAFALAHDRNSWDDVINMREKFQRYIEDANRS